MIEVDLRHRGMRARLTLDEGCPAALLEAGVWAQQTYIGDDSTLIVFADAPYEASDYTDDPTLDPGNS